MCSAVEGRRQFLKVCSHCRTASDIFTVFFVKQTILCLEFDICVLVKHCKSQFLPLYLHVYHPLVNYYELFCDCFCSFVLGCLV